MLKRNNIILLLIILILIITVFVFIKSQNRLYKYTEYSFEYFDTVTTVIGYEKNQKDFDKVCSLAFSELDEYHKLYTIYDEYEGINNIHTINKTANGEHESVKVDKRIIDLLIYSKEMHSITGGKVNIALGSVLSIWHEYREAGNNSPENAELPPLDSLTEANKHTDINDLIIDADSSTVYISDPLMTLDVGAVAKGYAVEAIADILESMGANGYIINVGGNVRTIGSKPNGEAWEIGIDNPDTNSNVQYVEIASLSGESLVTSGSYQRYYTVNGERYHHIIDSETLYPSKYFDSVSIICKDSALADVLSTALFTMPLEEGRNLIETIDGAEAMWIDKGKNKFYSSGFDKYIN